MTDFSHPNPEQAALLAAIRNNPDDDLPRLAYADWLDEHGESEAASAVRGDLFGARFTECWNYWLPLGIAVTNFSRGFIQTIYCAQAKWLEHGPEIVTWHPVQRVGLMDKEPYQISMNNLRWLRNDFVSKSYLLKKEIFNKLLYAKNQNFNGTLTYDSPQAAHDDLSQACIAWALEAAGITQPVIKKG